MRRTLCQDPKLNSNSKNSKEHAKNQCDRTLRILNVQNAMLKIDKARSI